MKKLISIFLAGAIGLSMAMPTFAANSDSVKIYVSQTSGNDTDNNGMTINSAVKTIERAQEIARAQADSGNKIEVILEGGEYLLDDTLKFTSADSGSADAPVVYRAYQGADVKLTLADKIATDFETYSGNIVMADISGVKGLDTLAGTMNSVLYQNGEMMDIASGTIDSSDFVHEVLVDDTTGDTLMDWYELPSDKAHLLNDDVFWGYWSNQYTYALVSTSSLKPESDTDTDYCINTDGTFVTTPSSGTMTVMNALEEIDEAGEYYVDVENGVLYYYPKYDVETYPVYLSALNSSVISIDGAEYISFEGIDVFCGRKYGFEIKNSNNITIYDSNISAFGELAIYANPVTDLLVASSNIFDLKKGAVYMENVDTGVDHLANLGIKDDHFNLVESNNTVRNTKIFDFGKVHLTSGKGITINGVGANVQNCEIYNSPDQAINFSGNDHLIENNRIWNVSTSGNDTGAIYSMRGWVNRGTTIKNNFIYTTKDLFDYNVITRGWRYTGGTDKQAIYIDDIQSGINVEGNIIYNYSQAMLFGGGSAMVVKDNVAVECRHGIMYDTRGANNNTHLNENAAYSGKTYIGLLNLIELYEALDDGSELKAKWDSYRGFTAMLDRVNTYQETVAAGGDETTARNIMGAVNDTEISNNIEVGNWAAWSVNEYVPEGGESKAVGDTWYDANDTTGTTHWKKVSATEYQMESYTNGTTPTGTYLSSPGYTKIYDGVINGATNTYTAPAIMSASEAEVTVIDGYTQMPTIIVGDVSTADLGVQDTDSYKPSYSPDEDGVNTGNKFTIVVAIYDENGALQAVSMAKEAYMYDNQDANITLDVPDGVTSDWNIKVMLWDSVSGLTPIANASNPFNN